MIDVKKILLRTRITVPEGFRALVMVNGKYDSILRSGRHFIWSVGKSVKVEAFDLGASRFLTGAHAQPLQTERPDLVQEHLTQVRTSPAQVALVENDGKLVFVLTPDQRLLLWSEAGPWNVTLVDVGTSLALDEAMARRIVQANIADRLKRFAVEEGQVGLLFVDGAFQRTLNAGTHSYWNVGRTVTVRVVDIRQTALDVTGQEVLTKDKVSIRVNLAARYTVVDPVKAVTSVKDFADSLYRAMQHAFRQSLATKTLDEILSRKGEVDVEASKAVRAEMAGIGIEVSDIAIKDVVLPGDMRELLNRVVAAEKEAEAQVIRRREETNATRSLLNTAKVMAENPVMLRLKELEALEKIADKVQTLTVHNGTKGLLEDIVSLRSPAVASPRRK